MPSSVGKVKTGNIILLFLMILAVVGYINREVIQKELKARGIIKPISTTSDESSTTSSTTSTKKEPKEGENHLKQETIQKEVANKSAAKPVKMPSPSKPESASKSPVPSKDQIPTWAVTGPSGAFLYLNQPNLIRVSDQKIATNKLTPVVKETYLEIETKDKNKGIYQITSNRKGKATITLMTTITSPKGKEMIDVVGTQVFTIKDRNEIPEKYIYNLKSKQADTLWVGKANPLSVEVAEVSPKYIQLDISGDGNAIKPVDINKGLFSTSSIQEAGKVTVTIKLVDKGNVTIIGKKEFVAVDKDKKATPKKTDSAIVLKNLKATLIGIQSTDKIDVGMFQRAGMLLLHNPSGASPKGVHIMEFTLKRYPVTGRATTLVNAQQHFTPTTRQLIQKTKVGDLYRFMNIKVQLEGQKELVTIAPLTVEVVK